MNYHLLTTLVILCMTHSSFAAEVVNVYSARHYDTDDAIYQEFEKKTGIQVQ